MSNSTSGSFFETAACFAAAGFAAAAFAAAGAWAIAVAAKSASSGIDNITRRIGMLLMVPGQIVLRTSYFLLRTSYFLLFQVLQRRFSLRVVRVELDRLFERGDRARL